MAIFKKLIVSGSNAHLNHVSASIFSGSFTGNGSGLTNLLSASYALTASYVLGGAADGNGIYGGNGVVENTIVDVTGSLLMKNTGSSAITYFGINKYWNSNTDAFTESTTGAASYGYIASNSSSVIMNLGSDNGRLEIDSKNRSNNLRFLQVINFGNYYETFESSSTTLWTIEKDSDTGLRYFDEKTIKIGMTYGGEYTDIRNSDRSIPDVGLIKNYLTASYATTASYALNSNVQLPSGLISSSLQFQNLTSPFTGSFKGDGSGLTGINSASYALTSSFTKPIVISPSEFGSDQHNYNPTGFTNSSFVRISGTDKIYSITGFSSTGIESGISKKIANIGTSSICLVGLHPSSSTANQISTGYNFIVAPKTFVEILYDGTLQKWLINGQRKQPDIYYEWYPGSITAADYGQVSFNAINSGTVSTNIGPSATLPGQLRISTVTTTNGGGSISMPKTINALVEIGTSVGNAFADALISLVDLSNSTDRCVSGLFFGTSTTTLHNANNTIGIRYSDDINSGKWQLYSINNSGTVTSVDTGITVNIGELYNLRLEIDEVGENVHAYINQVMVGTIVGSSLLPASATDLLPKIQHVKVSGTGTRLLACHGFNIGIYTK